MKSFKIYTENKNEVWIQELLGVAFDGFTIIHTKGFWKGVPENSLIVEVLTDNETLIKALAHKIKQHNGQEAVLVSGQTVSVTLV